MPSVILIDDEGKSLGEISIDAALKIAEDKVLDLVEIGARQKPPICKIMNYGKYRYQESKKIQDLKKKQKVIQVKELKLRPKIEPHDLEVKIRHAQDFVAEGHKVKVTMQFRGREVVHAFVGEEILKNFITKMADFAEVESFQKTDAKNHVVVFIPKKKTKP